MRKASRLLTMAAVVAAAACGAAEVPADAPAEGSAGAADAASAAPGAPQLVWMTPQTGAEVRNPVHVMFTAQNYEIAAVPAGVVDTARPGIAHHHVAVDTECLPAGAEIPESDPWVHFGDGGSMMNMQFEAGEHTVTIQAADDLERAVEGLCETITITVTE